MLAGFPGATALCCLENERPPSGCWDVFESGQDLRFHLWLSIGGFVGIFLGISVFQIGEKVSNFSVPKSVYDLDISKISYKLENIGRFGYHIIKFHGKQKQFTLWDQAR